MKSRWKMPGIVLFCWTAVDEEVTYAVTLEMNIRCSHNNNKNQKDICSALYKYFCYVLNFSDSMPVNFCSAMLYKRGLCRHAVSVTFVDHVKTNKHIIIAIF